MQQVLWVGAGGFLGAVLRFGVSACLPSERFAAGTLLVNTLGCLVVGAIAGWVGARGELDPQTRGLLVVGRDPDPCSEEAQRARRLVLASPSPVLLV